MAVSKQQKAEILASLVEKFKNAESIGFANTNGLTVEDFAELRKNLREVDSSYTLAKKTLIKIALKEAKWVDIEISMIEGQIWAVCSNSDAIAGLGKTNDFIKTITKAKGSEDKMSWAAWVFEWELKNTDEIKLIASMPSRETLLSRLVGSMKSPISGLARFFDAAAKDLESNGKTKVWELEGKKEEKTENEEVKAEEKEAKAE